MNLKFMQQTFGVMQKKREKVEQKQVKSSFEEMLKAKIEENQIISNVHK